MSNYYIKVDNTALNVAAINALNATGLISKSATDYVTEVVQMFWNYSSATKTTVYEVEGFMNVKREFAETNPSDIFILLEVTHTNYAANQVVIDALGGFVLYTTPKDFTDTYPNRLELTIIETSFGF
jgi:hypothetical protein